MNNKIARAKRKKRKLQDHELEALKNQQRLLYLRQRRKAKQQQMVMIRSRSLIRFGSVIFLLLAAIYVLIIPQWKLNPLVFANYPNKDLVFKDNILTKDSQLISVLRDAPVPKQPLYLINTDNYRDKLMELDTIKDVSIRRYWLPSRLIFIIKEKQPLFLIYNQVNKNPEFALTSDGDTISNKYLPLPKKYNDSVYKILTKKNQIKWDKENIDKYKQIIEITETATRDKLDYIDLRNSEDIYIVMSKHLIRLGEIDATVIERISRLKAVMPAIRKIENRIEYIDLRWDKALSLKERQKSDKKTDKTVKDPDKIIAEETKLETDKKTEADKKTETDKKPEIGKNPESGKKPEPEKKPETVKKAVTDKKPEV